MFNNSKEISTFSKNFDTINESFEQLMNDVSSSFMLNKVSSKSESQSSSKFNFSQAFNLTIEKLSSFLNNSERLTGFLDLKIRQASASNLISAQDKEIYLQLTIVVVEVARKCVVLIFKVNSIHLLFSNFLARSTTTTLHFTSLSSL